jgi:hypothetical protein
MDMALSLASSPDVIMDFYDMIYAQKKAAAEVKENKITQTVYVEERRHVEDKRSVAAELERHQQPEQFSPKRNASPASPEPLCLRNRSESGPGERARGPVTYLGSHFSCKQERA